MSDMRSVAGVLERTRTVIIAGHMMPDGDCVGSVGALGLALRQMGKEVTMALPDPVPEIFGFLPEVTDFIIGEEALKGEYDTFVVLDCSVPERLGSLRGLLDRSLVIVNIDHHVSSREFARYNYINPAYAATAEIILDLLGPLGVKITPEIATCLYTGIATDTGSFQYENTTSGTHRRVALLIEQGAPSVWINIMLHEQNPLVNLLVLGAALKTLRLSPCGRVAWVSVKRELLDRLRAKDENTDGLIGYIRSIRGVEVALLFRELSPGRYKVSFRSKEVVDVNRLASRFGGGGHLRAAGSLLEGDIENVVSRVVGATLQELGKKEKECRKTG
jgi:phosphoesterase RecJ-like protein